MAWLLKVTEPLLRGAIPTIHQLSAFSGEKFYETFQRFEETFLINYDFLIVHLVKFSYLVFFVNRYYLETLGAYNGIARGTSDGLCLI